MKSIIKHILANCFWGYIWLCSLPVQATPITVTTKATASLNASCQITATPISFGSYLPSSDSFATGNISTLCSKNASYSIGIDYSNQYQITSNKYSSLAGGSQWIAYLKNTVNSDVLLYNLFQDSAHTKIFGNYKTSGVNWSSQGAGVSVNLVGTGFQQNTPIYGAMSSNQWVTPGSYSINLLADVYF